MIYFFERRVDGSLVVRAGREVKRVGLIVHIRKPNGTMTKRAAQWTYSSVAAARKVIREM